MNTSRKPGLLFCSDFFPVNPPGIRGLCSLLPLLIGFGAIVLCNSSSLMGQDVITNRKPTLEERLNNGLRTRRTSEKEFVKKVVKLVDTGKLKQKTVDEAFFWVRRELEKANNGDPGARKHIAKYPFFYFQRIVTLNAKRAGVTIK